MGELSRFVAGMPGYFRENAEEEFPWERCDNGVWYSLLTIENGRIERYGFTSSKGNKAGLCRALEAVADSESGLLLGVWNGARRTDLFVLDIRKAISKLKQHA